MIDINEIAGLSHYLAMRNQMAGALVFDGHAPLLKRRISNGIVVS